MSPKRENRPNPQEALFAYIESLDISSLAVARATHKITDIQYQMYLDWKKKLPTTKYKIIKRVSKPAETDINDFNPPNNAKGKFVGSDPD